MDDGSDLETREEREAVHGQLLQEGGIFAPVVEALRALTHQHRDFVLHYTGIYPTTAKWNATESARLAGYAGSKSSVATAGSMVSHRPDVRRAIDAILEARRQQYAEILERTVEELAAIAFTKITDAIEIKDGVMVVRDTADLDEATQRALSEISETTHTNGSTIKIKMHRKVDALGLLAKITGGIIERHAGPDGKSPIPVRVVTPETVNQIKRKILGIGEDSE